MDPRIQYHFIEVNNIPETINVSSLEIIFRQAEGLVNTGFIVNGCSRLTFSSHRNAARAVQMFNGMFLNGKRISVKIVTEDELNCIFQLEFDEVDNYVAGIGYLEPFSKCGNIAKTAITTATTTTTAITAITATTATTTTVATVATVATVRTTTLPSFSSAFRVVNFLASPLQVAAAAAALTVKIPPTIRYENNKTFLAEKTTIIGSCVQVTHLPHLIDEVDLWAIFIKYGANRPVIRKCFRSKRLTAFINFYNPTTAESTFDAVEELQTIGCHSDLRIWSGNFTNNDEFKVPTTLPLKRKIKKKTVKKTHRHHHHHHRRHHAHSQHHSSMKSKPRRILQLKYL